MGIRAVIQKGGVFLVFSLLIGDASSVLSLAEGLPALLLNSQYSQRFEMESDSYAADILIDSGIGTDPMREILMLLHRGISDDSAAALVSTHPSLWARIENLDRIDAQTGD